MREIKNAENMKKEDETEYSAAQRANILSVYDVILLRKQKEDGIIILK